ncbi:substrate-binding periplasmic protein [Halopseudomonas salegens]|uniref:Amino acid ABC transporter substrate-binding protein, PAAT family n=1 Tax=Halopseudomonas salegens TaxID=1434072 RepID=A0A1H2GAS8_9GAMM|nr:transporter substrate-binding domain-containing protein [Halopseudomonas salegens]SDU16753.1 amino acid ABC transporter substrate-binding protein, PAAT family [Halopseudomonas salegens]
MRLAILSLSLLPATSLCAAPPEAPIRWGFSPADPAPYVITQSDNSLAPSSLTYLIGNLVADQHGKQVDFIPTPNNRIDESLQQGRIELLCNTQPDWHANPNDYLWTQPLYSDADIIVSREHPAPDSLSDLHGKVLGTTLGYHYADALNRAFQDQQVNRHDVRDISVRMAMVQRGRLDASIELRRAARFYIRQENVSELHLSDWSLESFDLRCAIAGNDQARRNKLRNSINELLAEGVIQRLVRRYD